MRLVLVLAAFALAAPAAAANGNGSFPLRDGTGAAKGSVKRTGLRLTVTVTGMTPGLHGVHLHERGLCEGPAFKSAGAHWNPAMKAHGRDNPMGAHAGDLPNIRVNAKGRGTLSMTLPAAAAEHVHGGLSLVVHAAADDYKTDPSGNSGDRIGCAVIVPPMTMGMR